MLKYTS